MPITVIDDGSISVIDTAPQVHTANGAGRQWVFFNEDYVAVRYASSADGTIWENTVVFDSDLPRAYNMCIAVRGDIIHTASSRHPRRESFSIFHRTGQNRRENSQGVSGY